MPSSRRRMYDEHEDRLLGPGEGCALGVILSQPMWAAIIGVIYWMVRQ